MSRPEPLLDRRAWGDWWRDAGGAWDRFWFAPRAADTLAVLRMVTGLMLAYVHLVWLSQVSHFFGPTAWIDGATNRMLHANGFAWSYLSYVSSPALVSVHQVLAIVVSLLMAVGLWTRVVVPLAWFMTLMVCHRQTGALFGLDQIVMMLAMYLMIAPSGAVASVDAWRRRRTGGSFWTPANVPQVTANVATRLIQLHLCVIYLFGGISKLRGDLWWEGSAMWWSIVNYEYQSLNVVWLGRSPLLIALATHGTLFWETFYCALVWPRLTRPLVLGLAVLVHGGIAFFLGMPTFGLMMIAANYAFIEPETTRRWLDRLSHWIATRRGSAELVGSTRAP
jgi:hypothetical protein